jgi:hypothetical protein
LIADVCVADVEDRRRHLIFHPSILNSCAV